MKKSTKKRFDPRRYALTDHHGNVVAGARTSAAAHRSSRRAQNLGSSVNRIWPFGLDTEYSWSYSSPGSNKSFQVGRSGNREKAIGAATEYSVGKLGTVLVLVDDGKRSYIVGRANAGQFVSDPEGRNRSGSSTSLSPGDPVEVRQVWAASGGGRAPLHSWMRGYVFVRHEGPRGPAFMDTSGGNTIVRATSGLYEGIETRWPAEDVRAAR